MIVNRRHPRAGGESIGMTAAVKLRTLPHRADNGQAFAVVIRVRMSTLYSLPIMSACNTSCGAALRLYFAFAEQNHAV